MLQAVKTILNPGKIEMHPDKNEVSIWFTLIYDFAIKNPKYEPRFGMIRFRKFFGMIFAVGNDHLSKIQAYDWPNFYDPFFCLKIFCYEWQEYDYSFRYDKR